MCVWKGRRGGGVRAHKGVAEMKKLEENRKKRGMKFINILIYYVFGGREGGRVCVGV